jgi:hypothetical protein
MINAPTIAIATIRAIAAAATYVNKSVVVTNPELAMVGITVADGAFTTFACASEYELPYELLPMNVAVIAQSPIALGVYVYANVPLISLVVSPIWTGFPLGSIASIEIGTPVTVRLWDNPSIGICICRYSIQVAIELSETQAFPS